MVKVRRAPRVHRGKDLSLMRTAETPKSRHNAYKEVQTLHSELIDHNLGTIQAFLIQLTQGTDALTSAQRILVEKAAETYTPFIEKRAAAIECIAARRVPPLTIRLVDLEKD